MKHPRLFLKSADTVLACFFFFPVVCCYWRGSWDLIGYYTLSDHIPDNLWVMAGIGSCFYFNYLIVPILAKHLDPSKKITFFLVTRLFMTYHAALYMFFWRGYWELANYYGGTEWQESLITLSVILLLLSSIGCLRSTMWPPLSVSVDTKDDILDVSLRLNFKPGRKVVIIIISFIKMIYFTIFTGIFY